ARSWADGVRGAWNGPLRVTHPVQPSTIRAPACPPFGPQPPPMPSRVILLVDDAFAVRGLARRVLEGEGYVVLEASTAEEALVLAEEPGRDVDLLLTDYRLPEMRGPELARRLTEKRPELITVYMSGYGEEALEGEE